MRQNSNYGSGIKNARTVAKDSGAAILPKYDAAANGERVGAYAGQGIKRGEKDNRKIAGLFGVNNVDTPFFV